MLFLGVFFDEISFPGQTVNFRLQHVIHIWKAMTLGYNLAYQEIISVHPTRRQIFLANHTLLSGTSENESYGKLNVHTWVFYPFVQNMVNIELGYR